VRIDGIHAGKEPPAEVAINNRDCTFVPHVAVAVVRQRGFKGTKIKPFNSDPFLHTSRGELNGVLLFDALLHQGDSYPGKAPKQTGVLKLICTVHPWMGAWIYVHSNPYVAVTDAKGRLTIDQVPPGKYTWVAWHETLGEKKGEVEITASGTVELSLDFDTK